MSVSSIITHPGGAHKDDFLACSLMVAEHGVPVMRREPTEDELNNPHVCVIDVGGRHEPGKNNYDHHQFPREQQPTCALSLALQALGLYEEARLFCDWLEPAEWFDCRGPQRTAEWLEVPREVIGKLSSPIDISMLRRFANIGPDDRLQKGDPLYELMGYIGSDLLEYLRSVRTSLEHISEKVERWQITSGDDLFDVLFLPRSQTVMEDASGSLARYIMVNGLHEEIVAIAYPDSRGEGFGLARFNDHPRMDFTRVEMADDVHFAHNSGFLCKTSATDLDRLRQILALAWE